MWTYIQACDKAYYTELQLLSLRGVVEKGHRPKSSGKTGKWFIELTPWKIDVVGGKENTSQEPGVTEKSVFNNYND